MGEATYIDLSDNQITELAETSAMSQLNRLSVSMNKMTAFVAGLRSLPVIQTMDFSINCMTWLPEVFIQNYATDMSVNFADDGTGQRRRSKKTWRPGGIMPEAI